MVKVLFCVGAQLVLLVTSVSLESNNNKGTVTSLCHGKTEGLYPFPPNCSQYISCKGEERSQLMKDCPSHLHFHPAYKVCVWEKIYPCSSTGKPLQVEPSPAVTYCKGKSPGVYGDPARCEYYMICTVEGAYHIQCPHGFTFDPILNKCEKGSCDESTNQDNKNDASQVTNSATVQISYTKSKTSTLSCEGRQPGKYNIPGACSYYYECTKQGEPIVTSCKKHRNFHPVYQTCVWTYMYSCDERDFCAGKTNGKYVNVHNCYGYYHCVEGLTFPQHCTPGLRFNRYKCVDPSRYICPPPVKLNVHPK